MRFRRGCGGALIAVSACLAIAAPASGAVVHVSTGGGDSTSCGSADHPCKTLAHAVSRASADDEVRLGAGTFPVTQDVTITKNLTIKGAGENATTLDGQNAVYAYPRMLYFHARSATIEDLRIVRAGHTSSGSSGAIVIKPGSSSESPEAESTVRRVTVTGDPARATPAAVWITHSGGPTVVDDITVTGVKGNPLLIERHTGPITVTDSDLRTDGTVTDAAIADISQGGALWNITGRHTISGNTLRGRTAVLVSAGLSGYESADFLGGITISGNTVISDPDPNRMIALTTVPGTPARRARAAETPTGEIRGARIAENTLTGTGAGDGVQVNGAIPSAQVTGNSITGYGRGIVLQPSPDSAAQVPTNGQVTTNQISAGVGLTVIGATGTNAADNWWGCDGGPTECSSIVSDVPVTVPSWIVLRATVTPTVLAASGRATVSVTLDRNNLGEPVADVATDTAPPTLTATGGTVQPANPPFENLAATATFTSTTHLGRSVTATKDGQTVTVTWPDTTPDASQADLAGAAGNPVGPDPLPACARDVAITAITAHGSNVTIEGVARPRYSGQQVFINYEPLGQRVIAAPTVQGDGSFRASTRRPTGRFAGTNAARYTAVIGGPGSKALKLSRRFAESDVAYRDGRLQVEGKVKAPVATSERVRVMQGDSCGSYRQVGTVRLTKSGTFDGSVPFGFTRAAVAIRLQAEARNSGSDAGRFTTYSIAQFLTRPTAR